MLKTLKS